MNIIDKIMNTPSKELLELNEQSLTCLLINLKTMKDKIDLAYKGLEGIKNMKGKNDEQQKVGSYN